MRINTIESIKALWPLWGVYWAVAALRRGPMRRRQRCLDRLARHTSLLLPRLTQPTS